MEPYVHNYVLSTGPVHVGSIGQNEEHMGPEY